MRKERKQRWYRFTIVYNLFTTPSEDNYLYSNNRMKFGFFLFIFFHVLVSSSCVNEIPRKVNAKHTTWKAREYPIESSYHSLSGVLPPQFSLRKRSIQLASVIPEQFDSQTTWPSCPSINTIRDQSSCASCWAFSVAETATDRLCIHHKADSSILLSEQDLLSCCTICGNGCKGGYPDMAWEYLRKYGVSTGSGYNSTDWCKSYAFPKCSHSLSDYYPVCGPVEATPKCVKSCNEGYPIAYDDDKHKFTTVYAIGNTVEEIKTEIMTNGPVVAVFTVYEDFSFYESGIYQHIEGKMTGSHAVKIVGWGKEDNIDYWRVANSWNEEWGENGFFRIVAGKNECRIEDQCSAGLPYKCLLQREDRKDGL